MASRETCAAALLSLLAGATPAAAQAKIEAIIPANAPVQLFRLGATRPERAAAGGEMLPGDMVLAPLDSVLVELSCAVAQTPSTYRLRSPFRVMIDVPTDSACHANMLLGELDVLAESPTQTTAGGVTLGSSGTQYAVEVRRTREGVVRKVTVYDGELRVMSPAGRGVEVRAGSNMLWRAGAAEWSVGANGEAEIERAAAVYARFDVEEAQRKGAAVPDRAAAYTTLKAAHRAVLAAPADTAKRVDLARKQMQYRINDQALYNLKRVDVVKEPALRRYDIDPAALRANLRASNLVWYDAQLRGDATEDASGAAARAVAERTAVVPAAVSPARIAQLRATADSLQRVLRAYPTATGYLALARSYEGLGEKENARAAGERALTLYQQRRGLTDAELRALRELIARNR